ncbi:5'/3'-nucleotidase SurE [Amylibacter sp. IMCC11727]|uniref:5'/3'-nucleotidase SurE n=1 Tax=Amylibacter sp. IMCC11727 TaxID=3039851 RepID=UPI00244E4CF6|nr:5'/3'-nucleotidase SurE [Amylibacter sp. IMCC11727]WGI23460.1 5'/3'-nucleotidase SurE [Amylibacter sp. IMCC11727]
MRILITNDDGIGAEGLTVLHEIACAIAGEDNVWTVAPAYEQSGVGHCISYSNPVQLIKHSERRYSVTGSPADCVLAGLFEVMKDCPPDIVLSGVNRGNNAADNTLYSGTIGACMEAVLHHVKSIALSQYYGPKNRDLDDTFEASRKAGVEVVRKLIEEAPWHEGPYELFYNVNFPPCSGAEVKGIKAVTQGWRENVEFSVAPHDVGMKKFLFIQGGPQDQPTAPGTDVHANLNDFVSVTPMRVDLTAHEKMGQIQEIFD